MNPIKYHTENVNAVIGSSKQGTVYATYDQLVRQFGEPTPTVGDSKVTHLWVLNIEGVICTIYDYKEDLNSGRHEYWHIGGRQKIADRLVNMILGAE